MSNIESMGASEAQISKIQSLRGGGLRLTLDFPENASNELMARLMSIAVSSRPLVYVGFSKDTNGNG